MIAIIGVEPFGKKIEYYLKQKNVDAVFVSKLLRDIDFQKLQPHSIIHFVWSPMSLRGYLTLRKLKKMKKKIVVSWIGSDVLEASTKPLPRFLSKISQKMIDVNLTVSENLKSELEGIKIIAKLQPLPVFSLYKIRDLPSEKKIAIFLPDKFKHNWNFYQGNIIKKLINAFPDVQFVITANSGRNFSEKNVKCLKWVDNMEKIYEQVRAVIRLPLHDGLSNTILETLSMGRTMITPPVDLPNCKIAKTFEEAKIHLDQVINNPKLNLEGSEYVHKHYDINKFTNELIGIYEKL